MLDILQYTSKAIFPRTTITLIVFSNSFISANKYCEQLEISDEFGLLLDGFSLNLFNNNSSSADDTSSGNTHHNLSFAYINLDIAILSSTIMILSRDDFNY